jgi:RNase H-fold protein (predicted Holliday junction resolvase)
MGRARTPWTPTGILHESGLKMKKHRRRWDAVAASLILEGYLNSL